MQKSPTREIKLSIKRLNDNPFDAFGKAYPVGSFVEGVVMSYEKQQLVLVNLPIVGPMTLQYKSRWGIDFDSLQEQYPSNSIIQFMVRARSRMRAPILQPLFGVI